MENDIKRKPGAGGARAGAGRKKIPDCNKKIKFSIGLSRETAEWIRAQNGTATKIVEAAIIGHYKIGSDHEQCSKKQQANICKKII